MTQFDNIAFQFPKATSVSSFDLVLLCIVTVFVIVIILKMMGESK